MPTTRSASGGGNNTKRSASGSPLRDGKKKKQDAPDFMKKNIKKVVYVMMENRSFDNVLGWMYDGSANPKEVKNIPALKPDDKKPKFQGLTNELLTEFAQPVKYKYEFWDNGNKNLVRGVQGNHFPNCTPMMDPEEGFKDIAEQMYSKPYTEIKKGEVPTMKGYLQNYYNNKGGTLDVSSEILDTYDHHQLPILNSLAKNYGVSDEWFCSIPSQTSINRAMSVCGNSVGLTKKDATATTAMVDNAYWDQFMKPAEFTTDTVFNVLTENGHAQDWKCYYSNNYLHGLFGYKKSYSWHMFQGLQKVLKEPGMQDSYQFIDQFYEDAKNGTLPKFSYLEPKYSYDVVASAGVAGNDYHPPGNMQDGEAFIKQLYEACSSSPDWEDMLFIIAWDENGGTLDHIPPPTNGVNPHDADEYECDFKFDRFGARVPMIFISPWIEQNSVIRSDTDTPFDHTAWLATLLKWFDLSPSLLGRRAAVAPTFESIIGNTKRAKAFTLPPQWDGKSEGVKLLDKPLKLAKAAEFARFHAQQHAPGETNEHQLLQDSLKAADGSEAKLAAFYDSWRKKPEVIAARAKLHKDQAPTAASKDATK